MAAEHGPPWTDPGWRPSVRAWIDGRLNELGLTRFGPLRTVKMRPWSAVLRLTAGQRTVFFKVTAPAMANDAALTAFLADEAPDVVIAPLAVDAERRWMLIPHGGRRLRTSESRRGRLTHWERLLPRYAEVQRSLLGRAGRLVELGAIDRRPGRLIAQLEAFLGTPTATRVGRPDGMTRDEARRLAELLPLVTRLVDAVDSAGIGPSIQHDDLHDGNVVVGPGGARIFDWGDAAVSHPFASLALALASAADGSGLTVHAAEVRRLRDAYLEVWTVERTRTELLEALAGVDRIYPLMRALTWVDAMASLAVDAPDQFRTAPYEWFREFLAREGG